MISEVIATYFDRWTGYRPPVRNMSLYRGIRDITASDFDRIVQVALEAVDPVEASYLSSPETGLRAALNRTLWSLDGGTFDHKVDAPTFEFLLEGLTARYYATKTSKTAAPKGKGTKRKRTKKKKEKSKEKSMKWRLFDLPVETSIVRATRKAILLNIPIGDIEMQEWIPKSVLRERQDSRGANFMAPWWWIEDKHLERLFEQNILRSVQ